MIIKNLGPIKNLQIHLNKETILFGKNNTGKTYVSYLLYGVYKKFESLKTAILKEYIFKEVTLREDSFSISLEKAPLIDFLSAQAIAQLNKEILNELPKIFNLMMDDFSETEITVEENDLAFIFQKAQEKNFEGSVQRVNFKPSFKANLTITSIEEAWTFELTNIRPILFISDKDEEELVVPLQEDIVTFFKETVINYLSNVIFALPNIIYIPAERNGINVFRNELIKKRSSNTFDLEEEKQINTYPLAISDYMRYLNELVVTEDEKIIERLNRLNPWRKEVWTDFSENVLRGKYEFEEQTNEYYYRELAAVNQDANLNFKKKKIPLKVASSSIKSLFGLENYLRFKFQSGDLLFIDEPEMNLDPENQVKMAKILVRLAELGVRVVISTHSDYLTRATSNEVLQYKVRQKEQNLESTMQETNVSGYYFENNKIHFFENFVNVDYVQNFDDVNMALENEYFDIKARLEEDE